MASESKAGIQTGADGSSFIPSSKRSDGTVRKEIRVRPGYRPPEDVEKYKNRNAEAWKGRGQGGVPGADPDVKPAESEAKSKNAKRREAARRKATAEDPQVELSTAMRGAKLSEEQNAIEDWRRSENLNTNPTSDDGEAEKQKKIRNALKKLKAIQDLKSKKSSGERLSPDQLVKVGKEEELRRELKKLGYEGDEICANSTEKPAGGDEDVVAG